MNSLKRVLFAGGALAILFAIALLVTQTNVSAVPPPPNAEVVVTNTPLPITTATPLPVTFDDQLFREPFETVAIVNMADGSTSSVATFGTPVPSGKRFVIEHASAVSFVQNSQKFRLLFFAGGAQYHLSGDFVGADFTNDVYTLNEALRLTSQPGQPIRVTMIRFGGNSGTAQTQMTISGYLIDG